MNNTDINTLALQLREAADKATKGPWIVDRVKFHNNGNLAGIYVAQGGKGNGGCILECFSNCLVHPDSQVKNNASYVALANPVNMLLILDVLEEKNKKEIWLKEELALLANFNPDWDVLYATQESLHEHMALLKDATQLNAELSDKLAREQDYCLGVDTERMELHERFKELEASQPVVPDAMPMQPIIVDEYGTYRFKANAIVSKLQEVAALAGYDLNAACRDNYSDEDWMQLAQLISYSITGYSELSYVSDESYSRALSAVPAPQGD